MDTACSACSIPSASCTSKRSYIVASLTLDTASGARLDLADNKLIVTGQAVGSWNGSSYTGVSGLVDAGRGGASNAQWDGNGIVTSDIRAVDNSDLCSIGVALVSQVRGIAATATATFGGQTVHGDDVLVMFTWGGDANLDGVINIDDYGRIDANVAQSGSVFGWYNGDFNYDGAINIDDYGIIDSKIAAQGPPLFAAGSGTVATPSSSGGAEPQHRVLTAPSVWSSFPAIGDDENERLWAIAGSVGNL